MQEQYNKRSIIIKNNIVLHYSSLQYSFDFCKVVKAEIMRMINCDLLKLSFVKNFQNKILSRNQSKSNSFWYSKVRLCKKNRRNVQFFSSNENSVDYWVQFFIITHINNHIIKYHQCVAFFIRIVFINVLINIIHINKTIQQKPSKHYNALRKNFWFC